MLSTLWRNTVHIKSYSSMLSYRWCHTALLKAMCTDPPRDTTSFTLTLYDTMIPRISLLAPSLNLLGTKNKKQKAFSLTSQAFRLPWQEWHLNQLVILQLSCLKASWVVMDSQCTGGQVGVLMFQLSVQSQASFLSVVGQKRGEGENFAEGWAGSNDVTEDKKMSFMKTLSTE